MSSALARSHHTTTGNPIIATLQQMVGRDVVIRDHTRFRTELGEPAILFIFVLHAERRAWSRENISFDGRGLEGEYHVGLVIAGRLINELMISDHQVVPLANTAWENWYVWGQGDRRQTESGSKRLIATKLLKLADWNQDGYAWEFRWMRYENSSFYSTGLFGYSAVQHKVIQYPVYDGPYANKWPWNLFVAPGTHLANDSQCANAATTRMTVEYEYDAGREGWALTKRHEFVCDLETLRTPDTSPTPTVVPATEPAVVSVRAVTAQRGEPVSLVVVLSPHGVILSDLEIMLPDQAVIHAAIGNDGPILCRRLDGLPIWSTTGTIGCPYGGAPDCQWGVLAETSFDQSAPLPNDSALFSCPFVISPEAPLGHHSIEVRVVTAAGPGPGDADGWRPGHWIDVGARPPDQRPRVATIAQPGNLMVVDR